MSEMTVDREVWLLLLVTKVALPLASGTGTDLSPGQLTQAEVTHREMPSTANIRIFQQLPFWKLPPVSIAQRSPGIKPEKLLPSLTVQPQKFM